MPEIIPADFDFYNLFHSSNHDIRRVSYLKMPEWIDMGLISCTKWRFKTAHGRIALFVRTNQILRADTSSKDWSIQRAHYITHMSETQNKLKRFVSGYANGGYTHEELSVFAGLFLIERGKRLLFEKKMNGRRVDLVSDDFDWVIECGDTNDTPILSHLITNGWTHKPSTYVCVIPFQDLRDNPYMYVFQRGAKWDDKKANEIDLMGDTWYTK